MRRFFTIILVIATSGLLLLSSLSFISLAQEASPFEISIIPQDDFAVAGQPFTYTVVVTNVSQTSLSDVFVEVPLPEHTTFIDISYGQPNWLVDKPKVGETGEIFWATLDPVAAGQVISFELIVDVSPDVAANLNNRNYTIALDQVDNLIASGPTIETEVVTPTPSPTATPVPSPKSIVIPTETAIADVSRSALDSTDIVSTPLASSGNNTTVTTSSNQSGSSSIDKSTDSLYSTVLPLSLSILFVISILIIVIWFVINKRK